MRLQLRKENWKLLAAIAFGALAIMFCAFGLKARTVERILPLLFLLGPIFPLIYLYRHVHKSQPDFLNWCIVTLLIVTPFILYLSYSTLWGIDVFFALNFWGIHTAIVSTLLLYGVWCLFLPNVPKAHKIFAIGGTVLALIHSYANAMKADYLDQFHVLYRGYPLPIALVVYGFYLWIVKAPKNLRPWLSVSIALFLCLGISVNAYKEYQKIIQPIKCCPALPINPTFRNMSGCCPSDPHSRWRDHSFFGIEKYDSECPCRVEGSYYDPLDGAVKPYVKPIE